MVEPLVSDEPWTLVAPLLPERPPRPRGGRPPLDDRRVLEGIVFVLRPGIPWARLPKQMGFGSGMTCWRRLRDWQAAGVWARLHRALLDRLGRANAVDFGRCSLDSASFPAKGGGELPGPNPTDRGKPGTKRHVPVDAHGIPLALRLSPANTHDSRLLEPLLDAVPPVRQCAGRPRKRPGKLHADTEPRSGSGTTTITAVVPAAGGASSRASPVAAWRAPSAWAGTARRGHPTPVPSGRDRPKADG